MGQGLESAAVNSGQDLSICSRYSISAATIFNSRSCPVFKLASAFLQCPPEDCPREAKSALVLCTCSGYSLVIRSRYSFLSFKSLSASNFLMVVRRLWTRSAYQHAMRETQSELAAKTTAKFSCMFLLLFLPSSDMRRSLLYPAAAGPALHRPAPSTYAALPAARGDKTSARAARKPTLNIIIMQIGRASCRDIENGTSMAV